MFGITMTVDDDGGIVDRGGQQMHAWNVILERGGPFTGHRTMRLPFYMGLGLAGPPQLADVLECLASDAAIVENDELDDIVTGMPFREARRLAEALEEQARELRVFLEGDYDSFVWADGGAS
jgi:hypothetical protein